MSTTRGSGEILSEHQGRDDGNAGEKVRTELKTHQSDHQAPDERDAANHEGHEKRNRRPREPDHPGFDPEGESEHQVKRDGREGDSGDEHFPREQGRDRAAG